MTNDEETSMALRLLHRTRFAIAAAACLAAGTALAQQPTAGGAWPAKPVAIVAPVPAGGGVDILSRALAQKLTEQTGTTVVVENRPGASAAIGTSYVARAPADGHVLLMGYSALATAKFLTEKLPYDLEADLAPVAYIGYIPLVLAVHPTSPANSVRDLIAMARANPGKVTYASGGAGAGAHLSGELLKSMAQLNITHVPYKGNAPALNDLLGGHVGLMFDTVTTALPHVKGGKLKGLATTGAQRSPLAPDLPTMVEAGLPGFEVSAWYMVFAPKRTPPDVLEKINAAINKAMADPQLAKDMAAQGVVFTGGPIAQANRFLTGEVTRWGKIIKDAGIKAE
jgi:tripartite-type tricarboxylate transporter receptor subunit TctC